MTKKNSVLINKRPIYHVIPRPGGGWQVKQAGIRKIIKAFLTQKDAIQFARVLAHDSGGKVMVRRRNQTSTSTRQEKTTVKIPKTPKPHSKIKPGFGGAAGLIFIPPGFDDPIEGVEEDLN